LTGNRLTGSISEKIGNLQRLEVLDISTNRFVGPIPKEFLKLQSLTDNKHHLCGNNFCGNNLFTNNPKIGKFMNQKQKKGDSGQLIDWEKCQNKL
jgi:hypothetical protein